MSYVNIGKVTEQLNEIEATSDSKVSKGHEVIEFQAPTAENNYTWYRKYADGWVEQGSYKYVGASTASANYTINLPVTMANLYYEVIFGQLHNSNGSGDWGGENYTSRTVSSISLHCGSAGWWGYFWEVKGMYAQ